MSETPYTQPRKPNIIKKHKESDYQNPNSSWFKITFSFLGLSAYCLNIANKSVDRTIQIPLVIISLVLGVAWWKICGLSPRKADRNWIKLFFIIAELRGQHLMNKLTTPATTLQKIFPLLKIHRGGLLEFTGREFGILFSLNPKRITDEERKEHEKKMKVVTDGLHDGRMFKTISCSKNNPRKAIIEHVMEVANKKGSKERAEHLNGILLKIMGDKTPVMMYRSYAFYGIGKHKTVEDAEIAKGAVLPGLMKNMQHVGLKPQIMEDENQIKNSYKEMTSERVIL